MSTAAKIHMAMRTPVRTAARMIVEVGTLFLVEPENMVVFVVFKSAFVCTVESGLMKLPSGVVSADVMISARVVPSGAELAGVVAGCIKVVMSISGKGVLPVSQIAAVDEKVSSAMYTLSELG